MKIKILVILTWGLLPWNAFSQTQKSTLEMKIEKQNIHLSTDLKGDAGYADCDAATGKKSEAYIFTVYRQGEQRKGQKGDEPSTISRAPGQENCSSNLIWEQVAQRTSDTPQQVFENMPKGKYKATVLIGEAIGCEVKGADNSLPNRSIVYGQIQTKEFQYIQEETVALNNFSPSPDAMFIFPNPTSKMVNIHIKDHQLKNRADLVFYDILGKEVLRLDKKVNDQDWLKWQVDVSNFSGGTYLIQVYDSAGKSYKTKMIVLE